MQVLLVTVMRWMLRHLLSLVMIIAVLVIGRAGWVEWQDWQSMRAESSLLIDAERGISGQLRALVQEINNRTAELQTANLAKATLIKPPQNGKS